MHVIEPEVGGIQKHHFPDRGLGDYALVDKSHAKFLRGLCYELPVVKKDFRRGKAVRLEDKLALEILNFIERMTVAVLTRFTVSDGGR